MGAYAPVPWLDAAAVSDLVERVHMPVLAELARRGTPFVGALYAGLIVTADGVRVLEFNCRFGDPETQVHMPVLGRELLDVLLAASTGDLSGATLETSSDAAVTVVLAAGTYPDANDVGTTIEGIQQAEDAGALVFHAGTARRGERLLTNGGRILAVTGVGATLAGARAAAYAGANRISFAGVRRREDVAAAVAAGDGGRSPGPGLQSSQ
jgi:phosphoribosylamine---glycine ligase